MPLLFVSNLVIGRAAVETEGPWTLAFLRWLLATLIMLPVARPHLRAVGADIRRAAGPILLLGFLGMWVCGGLLYLCLRQTTATNGSLIYATSPILVVLLDSALNRRPLPLLRALGVAAGIVGVAAIVLQGNPASLMRLHFNIGDLGLILAAVAWAVYSLVLKASAISRLRTRVSFFAIAVAGTLWLMPFALWETIANRHIPVSFASWLSIAGLAVLPSVLAFTAFQYGVKEVGAALTSVFMYLLPGYGIILSMIFLGEAFHWYHALGLALVVSGIALATGAELRSPPERPALPSELRG